MKIADATAPHEWITTIQFQGNPDPDVMSFPGWSAPQVLRHLMDAALANKMPGQHVYIGMRAIDTDPIVFGPAE